MPVSDGSNVPLRSYAAIILILTILHPFHRVHGVEAFEGAVGQGALATGGRGGDVYHVVSLSDYSDAAPSIPGTLRHAIESATGPRTVVFDVGGALQLVRPLSIKQSELTIAGQTAPGGLTLWSYPTSVSGCSNVVVRYLRFRTGDFNAQTANPDSSPTDPIGGNGNMDLLGHSADAVSIGSNTDRILFDHLSASWSMDETMSVSGVNIRNATVQNSIISESLKNSFHHKGAHGYGSLIRADLTEAEQAADTGGMTLYGNLWVSHAARNPAFGGQQNLEPGQSEAERRKLDVNFVNNVIYNWGSQPTHRVGNGNVRVNYISNYTVAGPATPSSNARRVFVESTGETSFLYQTGNVVDWDRDATHNGVLIDADAGSGATESFTINPAADMLVVACMGESGSIASPPFPSLFWNETQPLAFRVSAVAGSNVILIYTLDNPTATTASIRWESDHSDGVWYLVAQTLSDASGLEIRTDSYFAVEGPFAAQLDYGDLGAGSFILEAAVGNNNNSLPLPGALPSGQTVVATDQSNSGSWSGLVGNESIFTNSVAEQNSIGYDETTGTPDRMCSGGIGFVVPAAVTNQIAVVNLLLTDGVTEADHYSLQDIAPGSPDSVAVGQAFVNFDQAEIVDQPHGFVSWIEGAILTADDGYYRVVASAGASLFRDSIDQRLLADLTNRTGVIIDSQEQWRVAGILPGIDDLPTLTRPAGYDTDQDGMADAFEISHALDPNDPGDRNSTELSPDGYTNLERFLDFLTGVDVPTPYEVWSRLDVLTDAEREFDADPNQDGVSNGQAFLFGSPSPMMDASSLVPTARVQPGAFQLEWFYYDYRRRAQSGLLTSVEYGEELGSWTTAEHGENAIVVLVAADFYGGGIDKVTVATPVSTGSTQRFFRLCTGLP